MMAYTPPDSQPELKAALDLARASGRVLLYEEWVPAAEFTQLATNAEMHLCPSRTVHSLLS